MVRLQCFGLRLHLPPTTFIAHCPHCSHPVQSGPLMCPGLSLPHWFGLRSSGLYRVRRTAWSLLH